MFGKRKLECVVNKLECSVEVLQKRNAELIAEVGRLERILKYSSDAPTYHCEVTATNSMECYPFLARYDKRQLTVYIYVDKQEHIIKLDAFDMLDHIDEESVDFSVTGNLAYFDISVQDLGGDYERISYIIDLKTSTYVKTSRPDKERTEAYEAKMKGE